MKWGSASFCESRCPICTRARQGVWWARILQKIELVVTGGGCPAGRARRRESGVRPDELIPVEDADLEEKAGR